MSGRMMPTLAPLPSTVPLAEPDELAEGELELEEELLSFEFEPQAARDIAATTPSTASHTLVLRMRCCPFMGEPLSPGSDDQAAPMIVVGVNISL